MSRREAKAPARFVAGAAPPPRIAYSLAAAAGKAPPRKEPSPKEEDTVEVKPLIPTKANAGQKVRVGTRLECNFIGDGKQAGSVMSKSMGIRNGAPTTVWRILWDDGDEEFFSTAEILARRTFSHSTHHNINIAIEH